MSRQLNDELRVALVCESDDLHRRVQRGLGALHGRCEVDRATGLVEGEALIQRRAHQVYIVACADASDPILALIPLARAPLGDMDPPVVVIAAAAGPAMLSAAHDAGAFEVLAEDRVEAALVDVIRLALRCGVHAYASIGASERNLRRLVEALPVGVWLFDRAGQPLASNPMGQAIWGAETPPPAWRETLDATDARTGAPLRAEDLASARALKTGEAVYDQLLEIVAFDGARRTILSSAIPLDSERGGPAVMVVNQDLTRLVAAERALRESDERLRQVLESSVDGILVVDPDGVVLFANAASDRLLGAAGPGGLVGSTFPLPEGDEDVRELPSDGDGDQLVEIRVVATSWDGRPARLVTLHDVTSERERDRHLELSQRAIEASTDGIILIDALRPGQPITYVNGAYERMTGFSAAEVIGRDMVSTLGADHEQPGYGEIALALRDKRSGRAVLKSARKDSEQIWIELVVTPVRDETGRVTHFVAVETDITARKQVEEELAHQASHDALTGLPNRHLVIDRLRQAIDFAARLGRAVGVVFLDLDDFKVFNDTIGHGAGDVLLRQVAQRLREILRRGDTVARMGGDEFLLVCANLIDESEIALVTRRVTDALKAPFSIHGHTQYVSASLGVSLYPRDGAAADVLIKNADVAMYRAKAEGRNNTQIFRVEMNERLAARRSVEARLRRALERDELVLHYQPLVSSRTGRVCSAEALMRWRDPERGLVPPSDFIPIAEETGLIVDMGRWALFEACRQNKAWIDAGLSSFPVSVNVSLAQFRREDMVSTVLEALRSARLEPRLLELELTESLIMEDADVFIATLASLRKTGVRLAIDDFGTGYSSLSYLRRLPVHTLKIDRAFVREVHQSPSDAALCRSIIAMAHNLGLTVVAEGVETEAQAAFLRRNLCDVFQGFLFCKPLEAAELTALMQVHSVFLADPPERSENTVLLVDDEQAVSRALGRLLKAHGYDVVTVTSARECFDVLAERDIGVVVSDQRMPEMHGTEFLSRVKDLHPTTVRIILSGHADPDTITEAINRGAIYKYLVKPCREDVLRANLAEAFQYHRVLRENARLKRVIDASDETESAESAR